MGRQTVVVVVLGLCGLASVCRADDYRGWRHLVDKLIADGIDREEVLLVFRDPRLAAFTGLEFSPTPPREPTSRYRQFLTPPSIKRARQCRQQYTRALDRAGRRYRVPADVVAAILFVETGCGRNTGAHVVFHRLARLAMANEPANLARNYERHTPRSGRLAPSTRARLQERARYLEDLFYPEVRAMFAVARRLGIPPLDLRGSPSGAFGYPQFLPTSFLRYAVDGDGDGRVSLYDPGDAAASAAHYLAAHGWRQGLTRLEQRRVIWHYNRSDAYVDTILTLAGRIGTPSGTVVASRPQAAPKRSKTGQQTKR